VLAARDLAGFGAETQTPAVTALLRLQNVSKSFRGLTAVRNVSFVIDDGVIAALIGPNGAGKTTLFNMIAGALAPDLGDIYFDSARIAGLRPDQVCSAGIARTFQVVKPFSGLSVLDNVMVGALRDTAGVWEARRASMEILARLGLERKSAASASTLTLPDRKRLEVARALATRPRLLLLDEVMAGLRPTECNEIVMLLRELNQRQKLTILLIEHVMQPIMALAQTVLVMHHGEIIAQDAPSRVVRHPAVLECYLGEDLAL
jgi:branched-chain amino acid transport system ATP-binding protein